MIRIVLFILLCLSSLSAHKLNLFTEINKNELFLQSYFASGQGCHECEVLILKNDTIIQKVQTNNKGEYTTTLNQGEYAISVEATGGHKAVAQIVIGAHSVSNTKQKDLQFNGFLQNIVALIGLFVIIVILKRIKS